jgi:hypothetical protein
VLGFGRFSSLNTIGYNFDGEKVQKTALKPVFASDSRQFASCCEGEDLILELPQAIAEKAKAPRL